MKLLVSLIQISVLLLFSQNPSFAETGSPTPDTFSSTKGNSITKDTVRSNTHTTDSNNTMSKLENTTDDLIPTSDINSVRPPVEADTKNPNFSKDPLADHGQRIAEHFAPADPFSKLFEDPFFENGTNWTGENNENKSSESSSDGPKYRYGETTEKKFSNGQITYGEKSGYQSGENLEFGVAQNKATGTRAVGISVGKGKIYGHGAAMVSGNDDKSLSSFPDWSMMCRIFGCKMN